MRFLNYAIVIAIFIIVAIKLSGGQGLNLGDDSLAHADSYPAGITPISASDLTKTLLNPAGMKPTFLLIYASWCPYCKQQFPELGALAEALHSQVNFITLSADKNPKALAKFLGSRTDNGSYQTYIYGSRDTRLLADTLNRLDADFTGPIPYMALFDGKGKLLAQFGGLTKKEQLKAAIEEKALRIYE